MTYCVGVRVDAGLVLASDSRTNAGVDHVASYRKLFVWEQPGERVIVVLNSGNLAITQAVINLLRTRGRADNPEESLLTTTSMVGAAALVGQTLREVQARDGPFLAQRNIDATASFIVGGQIAGEPPRLFMIYNEGNYIEATPETPYVQIGETKYGKPIIDRVITAETGLADACKCLLVSFDSTMRSNISVGLPIDMLVYETDALRVKLQQRITEQDPYFEMIHRQWGAGLRKVFGHLPNPEWDA